MYAHHPALVSLSAVLLAALIPSRVKVTPTSIAADTLVVWSGGPPDDDDDARLVWLAVTARSQARYGEVVEEAAEHLFSRDRARLGAAADIGFFRSFYRAYAREVVQRLTGTHLRLEGGR